MRRLVSPVRFFFFLLVLKPPLVSGKRAVSVELCVFFLLTSTDPLVHFSAAHPAGGAMAEVVLGVCLNRSRWKASCWSIQLRRCVRLSSPY